MAEPTETAHDAELQKAPDAPRAEAKPESKTTTDENDPGAGLQGLSIGEF